MEEESDDEREIEREKGQKESKDYDTKTEKRIKEQVDSFNFKECNFKEIAKEKNGNMTCIIFGSRGKGKTTLLKFIHYCLKGTYTDVYVFSKTAKYQEQNFYYVKKDNIYVGFDEEKLSKIIENQRERITKLKKLGVPKEKMPVISIILDDVISDNNTRHSELLNELFTTGRHIFISIMGFLSQEVGGKLGINKACRANADLIITFYPSAFYDRKLIADQFVSTISPAVGHEIIKRLCLKSDYSAMVIRNFGNRVRPDDYIFWAVAEEKVPKFKAWKEMERVGKWMPLTVGLNDSEVIRPDLHSNFSIKTMRGGVNVGIQ